MGDEEDSWPRQVASIALWEVCLPNVSPKRESVCHNLLQWGPAFARGPCSNSCSNSVIFLELFNLAGGRTIRSEGFIKV